MAGQGNTIGGTFEQLRRIIDLVADRSRIGVCLDTCHVFAAGYDIRTAASWADTMSRFDQTIGMHMLKALHLNDSKGDLGCNLDRHENIGKGKLGRGCFEVIMQDARLCHLPMVLETPNDCYAKELKLLYKFVA